MKKGLIGLSSLLLVAALTGCGGETAAPADGAGAGAGADSGMNARFDAKEKQKSEPAEGSGSVQPVAVEAPAAEAAPAPVEAAAPAEAPMPETAAAPAADGLAGTKWTHNGIDLEFKEGSKVFLKGGALAALAPDGYEATYKLADGAIEVDVNGQIYSGTWDGANLVVDGTPAVKAQ